MANGSSYTGHWENNMRHGHGVAINQEGDKFEGNFHKDLKDGQGKLTFADGRVIEGIWKDDKLV